MKIPSSFRLSRSKWQVDNPEKSDTRRVRGRIMYALKRIFVYRRVDGRLRTNEQQAATFWHETTHAILHDMGHPLANSEWFVTQFSKRLAQVTRTAKLP